MATVINLNSPTGDAQEGVMRLEEYQGTPNWKRSLRRLRKHRLAMIGLVLLIVVTLFSIVGAAFVPYPLAEQVNTAAESRLQPPSANAPFGTDQLGRNLIVRIIYGGQLSLFIGVMAMVVQIFLGAVIGLAAGYLGGLVDTVLMSIAAAILSIPQLLLALIITRVYRDQARDITLFGRDIEGAVLVLIVVIGITSWMRVSRIVRSVVLSVREMEYITAARSIGASRFRIVMRHVLPNCIAPLIVAATLGAAQAILLEAYLGFLGLSVPNPIPTWGNIISDAKSYMKVVWSFWFFPGLFIMLTVLGINFLGDGLRDALDPKSLR